MQTNSLAVEQLGGGGGGKLRRNKTEHNCFAVDKYPTSEQDQILFVDHDIFDVT